MGDVQHAAAAATSSRARTPARARSTRRSAPASSGAPHRFRIDWNAADVVYSIDGAVVATHALRSRRAPSCARSRATSTSAAAARGRLVARDARTPAPASFVSRVLDAGARGELGRARLHGRRRPPARASRSASAPATRRRPTRAGRRSRRSRQGGQIGGNSRYVQYRAELATSTTRPRRPSSATSRSASSAGRGHDRADDRRPHPGAGRDRRRHRHGRHRPLQRVDERRVDHDGRASGCARRARRPTSPAAVSTVGAVATLDPDVVAAARTGSTRSPSRARSRTGAANTLGSAVTWTFRTAAATTSLATRPTPTSAPARPARTARSAAARLTLTPALAEGFAGTALPVGWSSLGLGGGRRGVGRGRQRPAADGALFQTDALYGSGRSLEFTATFGATSFQHVGFAGGPETYNGPPWAMFSTGSGGAGLLARTTDGVDADRHADRGQPARLRRTATGSTGTRRASTSSSTARRSRRTPVAIAGPMRPPRATSTSAGARRRGRLRPHEPVREPVHVRLARVRPGAAAAGRGIAWIGGTPAGTSLELSVRTGDTADAGRELDGLDAASRPRATTSPGARATSSTARSSRPATRT